MSVRQSRAIAGAIALFAFATVVLEIGLVRMFSALLGQHFGSVWGALLPLGAGFGALVGVFVARRAPAPFRAASLAHLTAFTSFVAALSVIVGVRARGVDTFDAEALKNLGLFVATSIAPFVMAGIIFSKALGAAQQQAGTLLRSVFAASACAVVASAFVMRFGPARVGLGVAVAISLSALLFARASRFDEGSARANLSLVLTFVLGTSVVLAGEIGAPYLKLASLRWIGLEKIETQLWTNRGFYTVDKPHSNASLVRVDGTFTTSIIDGKQLPPLLPDEMGYLLHKGKDPVLVVGVGGGREVRAALRQGHKDVRGLEEDVTIARQVMRGTSLAFSGELYDKPEVKISVGGTRNHVRAYPGTFQCIVVGSFDTQAVAPVGALATTPNSLFTTEFVQDLLGALVPEGTLTISRPDAELDRVAALLAHALRARGAESPAAHMFGCTKDKVSSVLVKRTPFEAEELSTLRTHCRRHKFTEVLSPDVVRDEERRALLAGVNPLSLSLGQTTDLRPPTDDRPFWFFSVAPGRVLSTFADVKGMVERQRSLLVLGAAAAVSLLVGLLALLVSLVLPARFWGYRASLPTTRSSLSLAAVSASIVLLGQGFVGRMGPVVGRLDVAATFFPLVFLLALSVGAGFASQFDDDDIRAGLQRWALATSFVMAPLLMGFDNLLELAVDLAVPVRMTILIAILGIVGGFLGAAVALAVRIASSWGVRVCSCAIASASASAAFALCVAKLISICWGYSAALVAGSVAILCAAIFAPSPRIVSTSDAAASEASEAEESAELEHAAPSTLPIA